MIQALFGQAKINRKIAVMAGVFAVVVVCFGSFGVAQAVPVGYLATVSVVVSGGAAVPSDFTVTVKSDGATPPLPGVFPGAASTAVDLGGASNYAITAATSTASADYQLSYSSGCSGALSSDNPEVSCTITATYVSPPVILLPADVAVTKTVDVLAPHEGDTVHYTITVSDVSDNNFPTDGVVVTDILPTGLTFVSATPSTGTYNAATGVWTVGNLFLGNLLGPSLSSQTLIIAATVNASTSGRSIANTATVTESDTELDPNLSNNVARATIAVLPVLPPVTPTSTPSSTPSADVSILKSVDASAPNEGDAVNYTLTVTASGPATSTGVSATDILPAGLTFVSASASVGSYANGTGVWTIEDMSAGGTATLVIDATVNSETAGQTITNTATVTESEAVTDPNLSNNTASATLTVQTPTLPPPVTPTSTSTSTPPDNTQGGGSVGVAAGFISSVSSGGGGGGGVVLGASTTTVPAPQGKVLGASTTCGQYLFHYLKRGAKNDPSDVLKLQQFLNQDLGLQLPLTGYFGSLTFAAVKQFQLKYAMDVLAPWVKYGLTSAQTPTGYVYKTTLWKINLLSCSVLGLPVPQLP
jgi:uncharacterized repeat protein (TIGR01451 family)